MDVNDFRQFFPARLQPYLTDEDVAVIMYKMANWLDNAKDGDWDFLVWSLRQPIVKEDK